MVIAGVLSAVAVPRLFDQSEFAARGGRDFVASGLRYAQKSAIAMRRNVCVGLAGSTPRRDLRRRRRQPTSRAAPATRLPHPANNLPFADPANALPGGAAVARRGEHRLRRRGRPLAAPAIAARGALTIAVAGDAAPVTVEPETGLVH